MIATMPSARTQRKHIAWLSPLPPQRTGIANYSYWLVKELKDDFNIELFYDGEPPAKELQESFATYPLVAFAEKRAQYDRVVYHLGNNHQFHSGIYTTAWNFPDTIVLHDYDISGFMHEAFLRTHPDLFFQALTNGSDKGQRQRFEALLQKFVARGSRLPMSHAIIARSKKVVVHHRWVRDQFAENTHIDVIPHFAKLNCSPTDSDLRGFREKFGVKPDHFVLTCLGFINPNKLPRLQIDVVTRLLAEGYPVQLIFAVEPAPELQDLVREVRSGEMQEHVIFTGYQSERDYFCAIASSDVIINLRNPSMGEASGTLMHALATAKPTIVSDMNQYREFPDKVCWKLVHDQDQNELLFEYLRTLLSEPRVRAAMSANAADYVENVLAMDKVREHWIRALET